MDPRLAFVSGREIGVGQALGSRSGERPRQGLADFRRPDRDQRADLALAAPFQVAREAAHAGERPHQRTAADIGGAARCHEGAHVSRREIGEGSERWRPAEMLGEKSQKLQHIAPVSFHRLWRIAPFVAEMREPAFDLGGDFGCHEVHRYIPPQLHGAG